MMDSVRLLAVHTGEFRFQNKLEGTGLQLRLEHKYSYNVKYADPAPGSPASAAEPTPRGRCRGEFSVCCRDETRKENFCVEATVIGIFEFPAGAPRDEVHRQTYRMLFPHVKALFSAATALCGVPPVLLPEVDVGRQDVYSIDMRLGR